MGVSGKCISSHVYICERQSQSPSRRPVSVRMQVRRWLAARFFFPSDSPISLASFLTGLWTSFTAQVPHVWYANSRRESNACARTRKRGITLEGDWSVGGKSKKIGRCNSGFRSVRLCDRRFCGRSRGITAFCRPANDRNAIPLWCRLWPRRYGRRSKRT